LLWPCLILFLPEKYLLRCISTACLLGLLYRIGGSLLGLNFLARVAVTIGCLDFLGIGALLAFYRYKNPLQFNALGYSRMYNWVGFILLLMMLITFTETKDDFIAYNLHVVSTALFFAWIIHKASIGFNGIVGRLL
jgi:hypothetical protein